jgi:small-conductance mechanosensitive channel
MHLESAAIASIIVSVIAALAGYASQRAAVRATNKNAASSSRTELDKTRTEAEKEAYQRARAFDMETIQRQDAELEELRANQRTLNEDIKLVNRENTRLHSENRDVLEQHRHVLEDNEALRAEVRALRMRFTRIERKYPTDEVPIQERATDTNPMLMREVFEDGQ